jgi:hypothetical protein
MLTAGTGLLAAMGQRSLERNGAWQIKIKS